MLIGVLYKAIYEIFISRLNFNILFANDFIYHNTNIWPHLQIKTQNCSLIKLFSNNLSFCTKSSQLLN
jgi:hypothetical protein